MQIISRRVHEGVVIGEETQIEVLEIDKKQNCVLLRIRNLSCKDRCRYATLYPQPKATTAKET